MILSSLEFLPKNEIFDVMFFVVGTTYLDNLIKK